MKDLYPSRTGPKVQWIPRHDPVVYAKQSDPSPLSKSQIDFYDKNGYLVISDVFDNKEVAKFNRKMDEIVKDPTLNTREEFISEPEDITTVRSIFAPHTFTDTFRDLSNDSRIIRYVEYILDDATYIHQARINLKKGFIGKEFYWHSDFETWHIEDGMPFMRALSCMIILSDNVGFNGPLLVMPGSHRVFISCTGETPEDHYKDSLRKQQYGVPDQDSLRKLYNKYGIVEIKCTPGSIVFFDCNLMHGSNSNISPLSRRNIFLVFNALSNRLVDPFSGMKPRPNYIATRN